MYGPTHNYINNHKKITELETQKSDIFLKPYDINFLCLKMHWEMYTLFVNVNYPRYTELLISINLVKMTRLQGNKIPGK